MSRAQDHALEGQTLGIAPLANRQLQRRAGFDPTGLGAETKGDAEIGQALAQALCEEPAVAHGGVRQVHARVQRCGGGQAGFQRAASRLVEPIMPHPERLECSQRGPVTLGLACAAQQHQVARGALVGQLEGSRKVVEAFQAGLRQRMQGAPVALVGGGVAGPQEAQQPRQRERPPGAEAHRGVTREQARQDLQRHARCGPRRHVAWRQDACVGKARPAGHGAAPLDDGDLMALLGELVGGGDADDAGAHDRDAHVEWCPDGADEPAVLDFESLLAAGCPPGISLERGTAPSSGGASQTTREPGHRTVPRFPSRRVAIHEG